MVNLISQGSCAENVRRIIRRTSTETIIYDHHLLRESKFKERRARAGDVAKEGGKGKRVVTGAGRLGDEPPILRC